MATRARHLDFGHKFSAILSLCSYNIAGYFHDLAAHGITGKKSRIVSPKAGQLADLVDVITSFKNM